MLTLDALSLRQPAFAFEFDKYILRRKAPILSYLKVYIGIITI